jgi:hypothetical protein
VEGTIDAADLRCTGLSGERGDEGGEEEEEEREGGEEWGKLVQ